MRRLVAPRLDHPDRVEVIVVLADHMQLAPVHTLQLPGCDQKECHQLAAAPGMGHEFAHHAESSHHVFFC